MTALSDEPIEKSTCEEVEHLVAGLLRYSAIALERSTFSIGSKNLSNASFLAKISLICLENRTLSLDNEVSEMRLLMVFFSS